jgi:hypothetical protein
MKHRSLSVLKAASVLAVVLLAPRLKASELQVNRLSILNAQSNTPIRLDAAGSFFTSGNVGFGTASPLYTVDVAGNLHLVDTNSSLGVIMRYLNITNDYSLRYDVEKMSARIQWRVASTNGFQAKAELWFDGDQSAVFKLYRWNGTANECNLQITSRTNSDNFFNNGRPVGIGTTTPNARYKLHVTNGGTSIGNLMRIESRTTLPAGGSSVAGDVVFLTSGPTNHLYLYTGTTWKRIPLE